MKMLDKMLAEFMVLISYIDCDTFCLDDEILKLLIQITYTFVITVFIEKQ